MLRIQRSVKFFAIALVLAAATAGAQPYLVKDLETTRTDRPASVTPLAANSSTLFLATMRADSEAQLWRSDGTAAGTTLLHEFSAGFDIPRLWVLGRIGETIFFSATDPDHGTELWRSDGTASGTRLVADLNPGPAGSIVGGQAIVFRDRLLFAASDAVWSSDGTTAGTTLLAKVKGANGFVQFGDRVAFGSSDGLWATDGSAAGTTRVGPPGAFRAESLAVAGNAVLFAGTDLSVFGDGRRHLWRSDLTPATAIVAHVIVEGPIASLGSRVVFAGGDYIHGIEPWVSDGTEQGTQLLRDIAANSSGSMGHEIVVLNGIAYFAATDATHGTELWRSDGTAAGTLLVVDIRAGGASALDVYTHVSVALGRLWMDATDDHGLALWTSDGTAAGTRRAAAVIAQHDVVEFRGRGYFEGGSLSRTMLYAVDDATPVFNVDAEPSSYPYGLIPYGDSLNFSTLSGGPSWITDGTAAGTKRLTEPAIFGAVAAYRGGLYFGNGPMLYRLDGGGPPIAIRSLDSSIYRMWSNGGLLFFDAYGNYVSNGTAAGTTRVDTLPAVDAAAIAGHFIYPTYDTLQEFGGGTSRAIKRLTSATESPAAFDLGGIHVFLRATATKVELWRSDGSADGTVVVATFENAKLRQLTRTTWAVAAAVDLFFFALDDGVHGFELWRSDGTAAGTFRLSGTALLRDLTPLDDRLFFTAENEQFARSLWITDGTPGGTRVLKDVAPLHGITMANGIAYFSADDGVHGAELWQSDGTAEGTLLVADVEPGPAGSDPQNLAASDNHLYFTARAAGAGRELWAMSLPPSPPTISIDDARVTRAATSATLTVSLSAPATAAVTADWAIDGARVSGGVTFAPGEVRKPLAIPLTAADDLGGDRRVNVRLRNVRGATRLKSLGTVVIEHRLVADLAVELAPPAANQPFNTRTVIVRNLGPSTAANVKLALPQYPSAYSATFSDEILAGASATHVITVGEILGITASGDDPDPNPANNHLTAMIGNGVFGLSMSLEPGPLTAGSHGKLLILHHGSPAGDKVVHLTSSNPAVIALPESVTVNETTPASLDVVALAAGSTRITAVGAFDIAAFEVTVSPAGAPTRWPSHVYLSPGRAFAAGCPAKSAAYAYVPILAANGATATGSVTLTEGSRTLSVTPLVDGHAYCAYTFRSGQHDVMATYSGDANFLPSSDVTVVYGSLPAVDSFASTVRWIDADTAELRITARGVDLVPAGKLTVSANGKTLIDRAPLVDGSVVAVVPLPRSTTDVVVEHSGDPNYLSSQCTVPLTPLRQRVVR